MISRKNFSDWWLIHSLLGAIGITGVIVLRDLIRLARVLGYL